MRQILCQTSPERTFSEQNQFGQTFLLHRSHEPFGERIHVWTTPRQLQTLDASSFQCLSELSAELGVTVVWHIAMPAQISRVFVHRVAGYLLHPFLRRMPGDTSQVHSPRLQMQKKRHIVGHQTAPRQHFHCEEIHSGEHGHMPSNKVLPGCVLTAPGPGAMPWRRRTMPTV